MARYIGPVCRLCRREGMKLFLKGERCYTEKCAIEKRNFPPGQHGKTRKRRSPATACSCARSRRSSASTACSRTSSAATSSRRSAARHHRRDAAAAARAPARQRRLPPGLRDVAAAGAAARAPRPLHGERQEGRHPVVLGQAGRRRRRAADAARRTRRSLHALEEVKGRGVPEWLQFDAEGMSAKIGSMPTREQINLPVQEQLIVELYSK